MLHLRKIENLLAMQEVSENRKRILDTLPANVQLVAVSKTKTPEQIMELYDAGQRVMGESKAQELVPKYEKLPKDIKWHMVGHLQRNKVKYIAPFVEMIESVDSLRLLAAINKEGKKNGRVIKCLFQMHIAEEETKYGMSIDEVIDILESSEFKEMKNISINGLMAMATFTDDDEQVRKEFRALKTIFDKVKGEFFQTNDGFSEISMGMTNDYKIAVEEGSTMVRIGTALFGER